MDDDNNNDFTWNPLEEGQDSLSRRKTSNAGGGPQGNTQEGSDETSDEPTPPSQESSGHENLGDDETGKDNSDEGGQEPLEDTENDFTQRSSEGPEDEPNPKNKPGGALANPGKSWLLEGSFGFLGPTLITVIVAILLIVFVAGVFVFLVPDTKPSEACTNAVEGHVFPVDRARVTGYGDNFGDGRSGHDHSGTDIMHKQDEKVKLFAITDGVVYRIHDAGSGFSFWLRSTNPNDKNFYFYTHMYDVTVKENQKVTAGQLVAHSGGYNAGASGDHLHLSVGTKDNFTINLPVGSGAKHGQLHAPPPNESTLNPYPLLQSWDPQAKGKKGATTSSAGSNCGTDTTSGVVLQPSHQTDTDTGVEADRAAKIAAYTMRAIKPKNKSSVSSYPNQTSLEYWKSGSNACKKTTAGGTGYAWEIAESNKKSPDYFISIHSNSGTDGKEVMGIYHEGDSASQQFAQELVSAVSKVTNFREKVIDDNYPRSDCAGLGGRHVDAEGDPALYSIDPKVNKAKYKIILEVGDNVKNPHFWTPANMKRVGDAIAGVINQKLK